VLDKPSLWRFEEFSLKLTALPSGTCTVSVIQSPYGTKDASFEISSLPLELPDFQEDLGRGCQSTHLRDARPAALRKEAQLSLQRVGSALFRALLPDPVLNLFHLALGRGEAEGIGLRIRLIFDLTRPETALISSLPWELIYREETREFVARNPLTPIVRYLEAPRLSALDYVGPRLKVLIARSSPSDMPKLQLEEECKRIKKVLNRSPDIDVQILAQPSLLEIRDTLLNGSFHILHFMGHGTASNVTGSGFLIFQDDTQRTQRVSGSSFAEAIKIAKSLRLVILNACQTAQYPVKRGHDPYTGVASAILMAGIPSVIAMQYPISDRAALVFSEHLYRSISYEMPIDAAAAEARLAIHLSDSESTEWATPVAFMSTPDGRIFAPLRPQKAKDIQEPNYLPRTPPPASNTTIGGRGGVTIGGTGNTIHGGIRISKTGAEDE
jgi:CHAT domain-containing protein